MTVLDKNDVAPTWGPGPWKFTISEEAPPNTVITELKAHDPDTIGTLTYTLVPNHRHPADGRAESADDDAGMASPFKLHPTTGQLSLAGALDRETKEKYVLKVRADDGLQHRDIVLNIQVSVGPPLVSPNRSTKRILLSRFFSTLFSRWFMAYSLRSSSRPFLSQVNY